MSRQENQQNPKIQAFPKNWEPSGQVFYKWVDKGEPSQFVIISVNFWNTRDFKSLREWAKITGLTPFDMADLLQIGHLEIVTQDAVPDCVNGHGKMEKSKKYNGWYCPYKYDSGAYCNHEVRDDGKKR